MTQTFFITTPDQAAEATATGLPCAFLCYRIRQGGALQSTALPHATRGGLLGIITAETPPAAALPQLRQQLLAECRRRAYRGVFFCAPLPFDTLQDLCGALQAQGLSVFLPSEAACHLPHSFSLLCGSLSGGSFPQMIEAYSARVPRSHMALWMPRCRHRFSIPCAAPNGTQLSAHRQLPEPMFYSSDLCTNYRLIPTPEDGLAFLLADDTASIVRRIRAASDCGVPYAFLSFDEWQAEAAELAQALRQTKE